MKRLVRLLFRQDVGIWLLMVTALACLPWALRREAPDAAFTLLLPAILIAASGTFILCGPRWHSTRLAATFAGIGALALFIRIGQIGEALGAALVRTFRLVGVLTLAAQLPGTMLPAVAAWMGAVGQACAQVANFAQRAGIWLAGIARAQAVDDPPSRALWLGLGLWLLAAWAGSRLRLKDDPLGALLPTTAALAITLDLTVQDRWPVWLHLAAMLSLIGLMHIGRLMRSWNAAGTDYSDSIREDSLLTSFVLIALVLSTAFAVSTFSLDDFLDRFRREQPADTSSANASGEHPSSSRAVRPTGAAGLQGVHIITAGPSLSKEVVMYIRTGELPPMPPSAPIHPVHHYWRGETYQTYNGRAWRNPSQTDAELAPSSHVMDVSPPGYRKVHAQVDMPGGVSGALYWTGSLVAADLPLDVAWRLGTGSNPANPALNTPANVDLIGLLMAEGASPSSNTYSFDALIPEASEAQLQAAPPAYPRWVIARYTELPDSVPERVRALARDITVRGRTPYDRAVAIEAYLRNIPYSLDVPAPPSSREATDYFLFDLKTGYCDYYATAMTVLARAAGLPARLVTGYASGSYDSYAAEYVVREADAHSWTEVYFPGIGWIEFEPTASQPLPRRETVRAASAPAGANAPPNSRWMALPNIDPSRLGAAWLMIPALAGLYASWLLADGLRMRWLGPEAAARLAYRRLRRATRGIAGPGFAGETATEYASLLVRRLSALGDENRLAKPLLGTTGKAIDRLTELYTLSLFAPAPLSKQQGQSAARIWCGLRWRLSLVIALLALRRLAAARRSAPSSPPDSPAA